MVHFADEGFGALQVANLDSGLQVRFSRGNRGACLESFREVGGSLNEERE